MNSFKSAFNEKASLTRFGRQLLRSKSVKGTATPQQWLDAIIAIENYRRFRKKAAGWTTFLLVLSILVIIFTLVIAELIITIGGLVGLIFAIVLFGRLTKVKFVSRSADLLCPIIATLREDMKPGAILEISLDYSGPTTSRKKKSSNKIPKNELLPGVRSRTDYYFEDPWLVIQGKLIDQTGFQILCQNDTREAKSVKRSASGKTKYKTKCKYKAKQLVTLKPAPTARQVNPPPVGGRPYDG